MTLQQQALHVINSLPDDKLSQVIQFAEYLSEKAKAVVPAKNEGMD